MSYSRSLKSYDDVRAIFDQAVSHGGVRVNCKPDQAVQMRARLHHFRALDREFMAQVYANPDDPRHGVSSYDPFVVRITATGLEIEPRDMSPYTIEPLNREPQP